MPRCLLWLGTLDDAGVPAAEACGWLAPAELERLAGLSAPLRRRQFLAGHWRVRVLAAAFSGGLAHDWRLGTDEGGRPWLDGPDTGRLQASISHSGEQLAVAVALDPIGLDIEIPRRERDYLALARHVFAPGEVERLHALGEAERLAAFNTLWALKEALGKRGGEGLQPAAARGIQAEVASGDEAEAFSWALPGDGALALAAWPGARLEWLGSAPAGETRGWRYRRSG
ncbi:4'-phosphopantetheinyl transferase superfamily protein [Arenimonas sp.]|uniref:4'-phosphopantetheinyl transferase family protein n=1 Tax=Arenimonas sp. TaxID=1872635 RepID=UPI0025E25F35|nr:4'-phosphopantetheinyl transferase superfamily protein [Arenimonas sp.]